MRVLSNASSPKPVEEMTVQHMLHPAIAQNFIPLHTAPDHNCMWNAICLCLGLSENKQMDFRNLTVATILKYQSHFERILTPNRTDETISSLIESCLQPNSFKGWGNEYHLLALAIALNRNIFVYSSFKHNKTGRFYQDKRLNISDLARRFTKQSVQTSQHLNYQPVKSINFRSPICLFYDQGHYTALIPRVANPIYCIPHQVIVESISDSESDLQFQNDTTQCETSKATLSSKNRENNKSESRWSKWYKNLSTEEKIAYRKKKAEQKSAKKISVGAGTSRQNNDQSSLSTLKRKLSTNEKTDDETKAKRRCIRNRKYYEANADELKKKARGKYLTSKEEKKSQCRKRQQEIYDDPTEKEFKKAKSRKQQKEMYSDNKKKGMKKAQSRVYQRKKYANPLKKETMKAQSRKNMKNQYADPLKKEKMKAQSKRNQKERYANPLKKEKMKAQSKKNQKERYANPLKREKKKAQSKKNQKERYANPLKREKMKAASKRIQSQKYASPLEKEKMKTLSRKNRIQKYANSLEREKIKNESRKRQRELYKNVTERKNKRTESRKRQKILKKYRKEKANNIEYLLEQANLTMQEFPALACTVCHRARFREQVVLCRRSKYLDVTGIQNAMTGEYVHKCDGKCSDTSKYHKLKMKEWICFTCDRHLRKGDIPPQAIVNGLRLDAIPDELKALNPLEKHLICIIQAFQKIVPLPKGGQKGVRGQMVCVPADLQKTADTLPWTPDTNSLIRVKLKRKLEYKGHHLFMTVSQDRLMRALIKLKEVNPHYKDIEINENWMSQMIEHGYTQMVDELHIPTEEEQYEAYHEHQKEEEQLYVAASGNDQPSKEGEYDLHIENQSEEEVLYDELKYGKEMLESWSIQRELEQEMEENFNMSSTQAEAAYNLWIEEEQDFVTEYEKHSAPYLEQQYGAYLASVDDKTTTIEETVHSNDHPLDQNIEHPFQCSSIQQIDPSTIMSDGDILSLAPSEGKRPVHALQSEPLCFPAIYPMGNNSLYTKTETDEYIQDRDRDISVTKYFDSRVLSIDNRFQSDSEWIFFAQYLKEVEQVKNAASIALKKGPAITKQGQKITAGDLVDNDRLNKTVFRTKVGYRYIKDIPGTPPYWENTMNGLFASFKQIGPPSFFISFSAADRRWPEIAQAILAQQGKDVTTWDTLTWSEYCQMINSSPVTAVQMFERRVGQFVKLMTSDCQPLGGKVLDCFLRREMQDRGWPHIHAMVWVEGAPPPDASDEEHIKFVEKAISCELPDMDKDAHLYEIITSVQRHSRNHSRSCFKNKESDCRFNYPLPIASSTYILRQNEPPLGMTKKEWQQKASYLVKNVKHFLTQTQDLEKLTVQDVLSACNTTEEEYKQALGAICKRDQVIFKRSPAESWVNFYNRDLLKFWNGNMDIQYIFNPYACAKYCLSYIAKAEREMGDLMRKAQQEARAGNVDAMAELRHLGDIYLTHRSVSVMEAVYRLTQLPLKSFTRDVVFIPIDDSSYRFSLPLKILSQKNEKSSRIWTSNMVDKYLARPNSPIFNNMSLAEFGADYEKCPGTEYDDGNKSTKKRNIYKLQGDMGYIHKRGKRAIIRYFKANVDKEPERYYKNLMRLYLPHRTLETFPPFDTFEALFRGGTARNSDNIVVNICDIVQENMSQFERNADLMEDCWEECLNNTDDHQFAWADIAPGSEEDRLNQIHEREEMEEMDEEYIEDETVTQSFPDETAEAQLQTYAIARTSIMDTDEINDMIRKMNDQQYPFLMYIRDWCLQTIRGEKPDPFFIHLTGSAGTGKSHLVRSIYQLATKILQQMSEDSGEVVLLTSFTGSAAFNIGGYTIHNLFSIPLNAKLPYKGLKNDGLLELQKRLSDIKLLIIDEISFVDKTLLAYIHGRLKQVKQLLQHSHAPFGHTSVLSVGDFFQLSPIRKKMICKKSYDSTDYLWGIFVLYQLDEIIRQKGDTDFSELLNRLRVRVRGEPLLEKDEKFLKSREIDYNPEAPDYPCHVYHLFPTWKNVHKHNELMLRKLSTEVRKVTAVDKRHHGGKVYRLKFPRNKETTFQPRELHIGIGARVMLKTNLNVKDGLCNSSIGTIVHIHDGQLPLGQPECIYIRFDDPKVGQELRKTHIFPTGVPKDSVPITPLTFMLTRGKGTKIMRSQYPLILAWAGTIHSSQGRTLQEVVVSLDRIFTKGQAYVALSRVTSSNGLYLINFNPKKIYCDESIIDCYAEMPKFNLNVNALPDSRNLTIVHHNVEGLFAHKNDILRCKQFFPCDILCATESHCQEMQSTNDLIPGYLYRGRSRKECYSSGKDSCLTDLRNAGKGGVGIFIANHLLETSEIYVEDFWFADVSIEHMGISLSNTNNGCNFHIIVIYRPPRLSKSYFCSEVMKLLSRIPPNSPTFILGDFNEDGHEPKEPIQAMFSSCGYKQMICHPTTSDKNGAILDHIYVCENITQTYMTKVKSGVIPTHFSFHEAVYLTLSQ